MMRGDIRLAIVSATWVALLATAARRGGAQTVVSRDSAGPPAANPADVRSIDAIMHAAYDVISGPAGPRDWRRFHSLFAPGARLIPTRHGTDGVAHLDPVSPEEFARRATPVFAKSAFYEGEIGRTVDTFGAVTHVFSTYASRHAADDPTPFARGINSFQLFNDGRRWYIVTIYWDEERPGNEIPAHYIDTRP
jgi:hypothetical protein